MSISTNIHKPYVCDPLITCNLNMDQRWTAEISPRGA